MLVELVGFFGAICLLLAYGLASFGSWRSESFRYQAFNIVGALSLVVYGFYKAAYANMLLNSIWAVVGLVELARLSVLASRHRRRKRPVRRRGA